ncbi:MAG: cysteine synthase family protein [Schleiferiaceae bacterium]|nr:cysteine synthase family protein [Schleiferiaceae bacterium]MDR9441248.1 cysteine synthase family protein [Schleiferiaceae bacterium]
MEVPSFPQAIDLVGRTPIVAVRHLFPDIPAQITAKLEYFNPGLSVKDRIAHYMVDRAEASGKLKPGGTIIECSSGNTGIGLAMVAAARGYRFICVMRTTHSQAKISLLKNLGAEVIICDGSLPRTHPESSHSHAAKLAEDLPNSVWVNQYSNPDNPEAHYRYTGPEIWEQTQGRVTHLVASASTGGTISGVGQYLKEKNPDIQIWASDAYGSAFKDYFEHGEVDHTKVHGYLAENVGKKFIPETINFGVIDTVEKVTDAAAALMTRRVAREEGLLLGYSCGAAFQVVEQLAPRLKPTDQVVIICPDHGSRYMHTVYNDDWMEKQGFLKEEEIKLVKQSNGSIQEN